MPHKTTRLYIDVNYDPRKTDPESLSNGLDILMDTAMSTPGILDEYGNPRPLAFFVLNEEAPTGDNFKFTGALRDQSGAPGEMELTAELKGGQLVISLEGLGDKGTAPGYGAPVLVEIWEGEPRVIVWSDINQEDPTHTIGLAGAAETCRADADPVDPSNGTPCVPDGPPVHPGITGVKTFQFSIEGFVGGDCGDDYLVKWVNAPSRAAFDLWLQRQSLKIENGSNGVDDIGPYTFDDGVDLVLDENGNEIEGKIGDTSPRLSLVDRLVCEVEQAGLPCDDLDDLVHDLAQEGGLGELNGIEDEDDQEKHIATVEVGASDTNNGGLSKQIEYIIKALGDEEGTRRIREIIKDNSDTSSITLPCFGIVVTLGEPDPEHPGMHLGGTITSSMDRNTPDDVEGGSEEDTDWDRYHGAINGIESLILAHACAGMDITSPAYIDGIETAVEACGNHL